MARGVHLGHRRFLPVAILLTKGAQDVDNLFDGFSSDQQTALAAQIKGLKKKTSQRAEWSQQLKVDLANKNSDPKKVQKAMHRIDKLTKQIQ